MSSSTLSVGFLGAGKMATALAKGFIQAGLVAPPQVCASDVLAAGRDAFQRETNAAVFTENADVLRHATVIFLAVKPDQISQVLAGVAPQVDPQRHLFVSIAAGVTLACGALLDLPNPALDPNIGDAAAVTDASQADAAAATDSADASVTLGN